MSRTKLFLHVLVAVAMLIALGLTGVEIFSSLTTFVACLITAVVVAVVIVGSFSYLYGEPEIIFPKKK